MFYTYVLLSQKDNKFYIGWTDDLRNRIDKHNSGEVTATKNRLPLKLVYYEACVVRIKQLKEKNILSLVLVEVF